ncbi:hypothetical protein [Deinococcus sp. Leaf326]|uniref:hypothetical protein n=1 Tax=Deinococcus sp. Leaf326 TaxID=1736338 RepID=UPI0006F2B992|nr:hypothetical protein [Deinococcus sp. Leaf326]KQR37807.1 hypothetical protein ASF71_15105 [Deinococcus sp. Leaf326]
MNEAMNALAEAVTAAEEALEAAKAGRWAEARTLLGIMDSALERGEGGNATHASRRRKILRLEAEVHEALKAEPVAEVVPAEAPAQPEVAAEQPALEFTGSEAAPEVLKVTPAAEPELPAAEVDAPAEVALLAPELPVADLESEKAPTASGAAPAPVQPDAAPVAAKAPRNVAPPKELTAEAWNRVGTALRLQGMDAAERAAALPDLQVALNEAKIARNTHGTKVAEAALLQARVDVAALEGDVDGANAAWDRLFNVTTGLRGAAQKLQRAGTPDAAKTAAYEQARQFNLRVSAWGRGVNAA